MSHVFMEDIFGNKVAVDMQEVRRKCLDENTLIYGMPLAVMKELQCAYLTRNGAMLMTPESVREVFGHEAD